MSQLLFKYEHAGAANTDEDEKKDESEDEEEDEEEEPSVFEGRPEAWWTVWHSLHREADAQAFKKVRKLQKSDPGELGAVWDRNGMSLLHKASMDGRVRCVVLLAQTLPELLLKRDSKGRRPLDVAQEFRQGVVAKALQAQERLVAREAADRLVAR